jgi:prefoldin subunit 5
MNTRATILTAAVLAISPALVVGCATPAYKKGDSTAAAMKGSDSAADALLMAAQNAQTYFTSMTGGELKAIFPRFEKEVDSFDSSAKRLNSSIGDVRSSAKGYIDSLVKTQESIENESLKAQTQLRIDRISEELSQIDGLVASVESLSSELSKSFSDVRKFLSADLSARAVRDAEGMWKNVDATIGRLGTAITDLKRELADVQTAISSDA